MNKSFEGSRKGAKIAESAEPEIIADHICTKPARPPSALPFLKINYIVVAARVHN